ncbi:glycoprotein-N-acetylgalactosamine 3-beta-galactosyltransferase 1-like isoform X2 [Physella acuta]|uniref:glycoprotein-N-acetylgalactosamine 3-beta-galactosyltransferase 1-like isoform X2 n=1 Tax=Physella acuta TaxID=109671 RepID=UPI0027DB3EC4|nr:glycoprotein-N-acetylgalactosamine 3-beta-galactosyltransferase 1-like isoform X2 [Physella acuta]
MDKHFIQKCVMSLFKKTSVHFILGICLGLSFSFILYVYEKTNEHNSLLIRSIGLHLDNNNHVNCENNARNINPEFSRFPVGAASKPHQQKLVESQYHHDDDLLAKELHSKVRVACWIMTSPDTLLSKAIHIKNTWAKRCNLVLFMSSVADPEFPAVGLDVPEGREHLTAKTMKAFKYLYDHHMEDADWFLKADDDTYVIVENLRYLLLNEDPAQPVYFGQRFKPYVRQGYTSGGGGYVLSKEALRRFGEEGSVNAKICAKDGGPEDVYMGKCMQNLGVKLKDSTDSLNRSRFHCFNPETVLKARFPKWFINFDVLSGRGGIENISDYAVSFHYIHPNQMYTLEFFIYHLRPYGILNSPQSLNKL